MYVIREYLQLRWALCNSPSTETPLTSDFVRVAHLACRYSALAFYPGGEARFNLGINYDAAGNASRGEPRAIFEFEIIADRLAGRPVDRSVDRSVSGLSSTHAGSRERAFKGLFEERTIFNGYYVRRVYCVL